MSKVLISVSNKTGIVDFARELSCRGFEIISTGGTAQTLRDANLSVTDVSDITDFPEGMGGRLKTLHPRIHGGLLGRPCTDDKFMMDHGIPRIDLLVVNLYPFTETIAEADCTFEGAIENIDIGGPAMIRAAAKNHQRVTVVVDPLQYSDVIKHLDCNKGWFTFEFRLDSAFKAFEHTANYDTAIKHYLSECIQKRK